MNPPKKTIKSYFRIQLGTTPVTVGLYAEMTSIITPGRILEIRSQVKPLIQKIILFNNLN